MADAQTDSRAPGDNSPQETTTTNTQAANAPDHVVELEADDYVSIFFVFAILIYVAKTLNRTAVQTSVW